MDIETRQPKQFLTKASGFLKDYSHTLNPYMGCQFACSYCYVRKSPVSLFSGKTWGEWVTIKKDVGEQFKKELHRAKQKGAVTIFMSSSTDPYQPIEKHQHITRHLLKVLSENPPDFLFIQTRGPLIQRDIDILKAYPGRFIVSMTIETDREEVLRTFTPSAPSIKARLIALKKLRRAGIPTQIAIAPVLPCTDQFAKVISPYTDKVTIDDYFMGDGSHGQRTQSLGIERYYDQLDEHDWYHKDAYRYVVQLMEAEFGHDNVFVNIEGFRPT
ncbi:SPL family radical SAM protein [Staphylococcus canis]|uniref:Radical SAM protein n=1 Tax=Staphylococcus canis TaxID=2724942 RepID=A0ABS0T7R2_9STAP|nr:radical SAM protein [Staphylococcus canis]MBI5974784.1 radical SAM protein [Staphylococcus canis]